ncbi:MAG TPA: hypothetical protein VGY58_12265 [Gemmataceae bacterium]|nr:hypothetical protein [Gemmataceae bacterium]
MSLAPAALDTPHAEYQRRQAVYQALAAKQARLHRRIANMRVAVVAVTVLLAFLASGGDPTARVLLLFPLLLFPALVVWQNDRVARVLQRAERGSAFYEKGLARLEGRWMGAGQQGTRYLDENHPCALDLDLFGSGSLFERLCIARTRRGEDTLAAWLLAPAGPDEVRARQEAVAELRGQLDLRENLAMLAADVSAGVDLDAVASWSTAPAMQAPSWARLAAVFLPALTVLALLGWFAFGLGGIPFVLLITLEISFAAWLHTRVRAVIGPVESRARDLFLLSGILARIERQDFHAARLRRLRDALQSGGMPPSRRIAQLGKLVDWLNARRNQFFAPLALLLLWSTQLAFAIESWRASAGRAVARWLDVVGEFEALNSLAAYAYENPGDPFPEIVPGEALYDGQGLGHPLIASERCVRNDLHLGGAVRVLIVSGSNMSGKSTLLRTVGINAVLALAGGPVRAGRLRLSPLVVGATLRIQDSLQAGRSRFYAEITRIRQLVDLAKGYPPLLFLLDEMLQGTNSHDRRLGAEAIVRSLVDYGAIGLITTHDLALTEIADLLAPKAQNVHFEDQFENGAMSFDYRMRPGVVKNSNALALMRAVGIEV